jgi:peptidoglycan/LPS O-acetylase OafA/YrhL
MRHESPDTTRRNSIGALRVLLAVLVLYSHAHFLGGFPAEWFYFWSAQRLILGSVAVQCFFVLSGWLVVTSWRRRPAVGRFLWHRLLRLAPAFWVCLAFTAFVLTPLLWLTTPDAKPLVDLLPAAAGYIWHNLFLPRSQISVGPFPNGGPWGVDWNGSLWTLFYEGTCYLLVVALGLVGLLGRGRVAGTALIGALLAGNFIWPGTQPFYNTPGKLLMLHFFAGGVWAMWPAQAEAALGRPWLASLAAVVLVASWHESARGLLSPLLVPPALLWLCQNGPLQNFEQWAGGDYSYGLYIYGYPIQQTLTHFQFQRFGFGPFLTVGLALTLALAVASWRLIERRALMLKGASWPRLLNFG